MSRDSGSRLTHEAGSDGQMSASTKVFNCIVDDTALVAGVKRSTRNGLRQWVKNGQVRLFVPLHALEQLNYQKNAASRHAEDVIETLTWLDHATTRYPNAIALQGGEDVFETWEEVSQFAVPRSLFSEDDQSGLDDHLSHDRDSLHPSAAPAGAEEGYANPQSDEVPLHLRPLFNYILWRIHQEIDPVAALQSFIFICNDQLKSHLAKGFEVRCKRLEQLRETVAREERDDRTRNDSLNRGAQSGESTKEQSRPVTPPKAPAAMLSQQTRVLNPNAFSRTPVSPRSSRPSTARGAQHSHRSQRSAGRGGSTEWSAFVTRSALKQDLGHEPPPLHEQIDPNSFERPREGNRGRGDRKLWSPG